MRLPGVPIWSLTAGRAKILFHSGAPKDSSAAFTVLATQVHVPCQVTVSLLRAAFVSAPQLLKSDTEPEHSGPASESGFKGQLDDAVQQWQKGQRKNRKHDSSSDDGAREPAAKDEDHPQLAILAVVEAILP